MTDTGLLAYRSGHCSRFCGAFTRNHETCVHGVTGPQDGALTESRRKRLQLETDSNKGMTLPFRPLNLAFQHMYYSVDMPPVGLPSQSLTLTYTAVSRVCCNQGRAWNKPSAQCDWSGSDEALSQLCEA